MLFRHQIFFQKRKQLSTDTSGNIAKIYKFLSVEEGNNLKEAFILSILYTEPILL